MSHTPLHVSAGSNQAEIVKFLLEWQGEDKVELEAQNMYGETALHMAAKNGCNEAARLLIAHDAFVEAKSNNGRTPLHLSVWHSIRAEDFSTLKTLLENKADCSAMDEEYKTPIDYLSLGPENGKLRELLLGHHQEQRKRKALEACSEINAKMEELENELTKIVGMNDLKTQLRKWAKGILLNERRRSLGLKVGTRRPPHMAFLGNPGTGKTMIARTLGRLLHMAGVLPTDMVKEVQRTDLVGQYVGHTGPKTRRKIKEAEGGILFVDEAYRLIPTLKSDNSDFGLEALEEIMSVMDSGIVLVIFAGYTEPMTRVIASNEGFRRRVTKFFYFNDFSCEELAKIVHVKMNDQVNQESLLYGFKLHFSCNVDVIAELINRETTEKQRREMNGGLVGPMLDKARENLDHRLSFQCVDSDELLTITSEDLETGLRSLFR